ncbi:MAG: hypothetical protein Q7N95_09120, partial [Alphaproteobacteria bacterium]|nr:hypothetical protein [Alphaproteobacteria bacterium]
MTEVNPNRIKSDSQLALFFAVRALHGLLRFMVQKSVRARTLAPIVGLWSLAHRVFRTLKPRALLALRNLAHCVVFIAVCLCFSVLVSVVFSIHLGILALLAALLIFSLVPWGFILSLAGAALALLSMFVLVGGVAWLSFQFDIEEFLENYSLWVKFP